MKQTFSQTKPIYVFYQKYHSQQIPGCFPYNVGRQNKREPHDLQKCTVLYR